MTTIECTITSPLGTKVYSQLQSVTLPAVSGVMQVLPGHAESFAMIAAGTVTLKNTKGEIEAVRVSAGECHIRNNSVLIIV
jgi:F0F1-type ATP synthase epsilon subunit